MKRIVMLSVGLALLLPAPVAAQGSATCQAYNPQLCGVSGVTGSRPGASTQYSGASGGVGTAGSTDPLPFTGLDLALLVACAGGLLAAGVLVRRLSRLT